MLFNLYHLYPFAPNSPEILQMFASGSRRGLITVEVGLKLMQTLPDRAQFRDRRPVMQEE